MVKVCVIQSDNRISLDYLLKTQKVTKMFCNYLKYDYEFIEIKNNEHSHLHPATKKIHVVHDFIQSDKYDILVFLDSDAWIQNGNWLKEIIHHLANDDKHGCFSRDPYLKINTFINSGSFILKINDYTRNMYKQIINDLTHNTAYHNLWPYDQYYISDYVFKHKDHFIVFVPDIMNTPIGKVLRHNWLKNEKMHDDLNLLMSLKKEDMDTASFPMEVNYDKKTFPNLEEKGYEYKDVQESFQNQIGYEKVNYLLNPITYVLILISSLFILYCVFIFYKPKTKYLTRYSSSRKRRT